MELRRPSLRGLTFRRKVMLVATATSSFTLLLALSVLLVFEMFSFRAGMVADLNTLAEFLSTNVAAPLIFQDRQAASEKLAALETRPDVIAAIIYDKDGVPFASLAGSEGLTTPLADRDGHRIEDGDLLYFQSVYWENEYVGKLYLRSELSAFSRLAEGYTFTALFILLASFFVAGLLSSLLEGILSRPINRLAVAARAITDGDDYTVRVEKESADEIGQLTESFNQMLDQIELRDDAVRLAKDEQEKKIETRTRLLRQEILERQRVQDHLETAKRAAEQASAAKSSFLANMSHEIRTPMNGIVGMAELLTATGLDGQQRRYLSTIRICSDTLLLLINDILDFSKIEAGKMELELLDFDLCSEVESVAEMAAAKAGAKDVELSCRVDPDVPERLRGDPVRIRQILLNLVGNALKFTEEGEVAIDVSLESIERNQAQLRCEVRDTGIGIAPERLQHIFDSFTQEDESTTRRHGGTGLGLSISRQLVEMMGGELSVRSEPGRGSSFWFQIPLERPRPDASLAARAPVAEGLRVLVVDDHPTSRDVLSEMVGAAGASFTACPDGEAALALLRTRSREVRPYDVALVDLHMSGMNGLALAERMQADPDIPETFVVLLCALQDLQEVSEMGISDAQLTKPVRRDECREVLRNVLESREGAPATGSTRGQSDRSAHQGQAPRVLVVEDNPVNQEFAAAVLERAGIRHQIARDGKAALDTLETERFDLILMDCQMPRMDGFEATAEIRRREGKGPRMPIIALTANAVSGDRDRCLAAGMDDYLFKPIDPEALVERIYRLTEREPGEPAAQEVRPVPPVVSSGVDYEAVVKRCMGDRELADRLLLRFRDLLAEQMAELRSSLAGGDLDTARNLSHQLKGAAANLAVEEVRRSAAELEAGILSASDSDLSAQMNKLEHVASIFLDKADEAGKSAG